MVDTHREVPSSADFSNSDPPGNAPALTVIAFKSAVLLYGFERVIVVSAYSASTRNHRE